MTSRRISTKEERRREQNRLNQQAWRQRQRLRRQLEHAAASQQQLQEQDFASIIRTPLPDLSVLIQQAQAQKQHLSDEQQANGLTRPGLYWFLTLLEASAYQSSLGSPNTDHRLTLVKLNVFRALVKNIRVLGWKPEWMTDDAVSPLCVSGPPQLQDSLREESIPASLRPTPLQKAQAHHPWLDIFPFARMRDNLIQHEDYIDDSYFCHDLMGFYNSTPSLDNGDSPDYMLVWGDPWDPMNWEVTEPFLHKWGWTVKGCPEIIWSSNHWRHTRGERKLPWKVNFID